jgi:glycosyltransferase involved in cell wall biosynthesis
LNRSGVILRMGGAAHLIVGYVQQLNEAIHRIMPDVVHSNGLKMHLLGALATPRRMPIVWHLHDYIGLRPLMSRLLRLNIHRCAGMIANSQSVADDTRRVFGSRVPIQTVYNAVDLSKFAEGTRLDLDCLAGMAPPPSNTLRIGMVATMARWKGHEVFLRALAMLPAEIIRGYIIGGPIYHTAGSQYSLAELRRMASALHLDGRVGFTGFISDTASAIRALDIVVHASVAPEPFGLAVAEAFACSRAVVASRGGGVLEIVRENENALAHTPGNACELAKVLARLVSDGNLRRTLGAAARKTAERSFTRARLAHDLMGFYQTVKRHESSSGISQSNAPAARPQW